MQAIIRRQAAKRMLYRSHLVNMQAAKFHSQASNHQNQRGSWYFSSTLAALAGLTLVYQQSKLAQAEEKEESQEIPKPAAEDVEEDLVG